MAEVVKPPDRPFEPFVPPPGEADPRWVGHLFRRAGFGPTLDWLDRFGGQPPRAALDWLLDFDPAADPMAAVLEQSEGLFNPAASIESAQEWWAFRMLHSPRPLQERVALLWHNHFATGAGKVNSPAAMAGQIDLFRRLGLGSFRDLLLAVGRDPAMLIWLDGQSSRRGKPNENYAREVMELFTLGIGNYTEKDVKELARAFTGWRLGPGGVSFDPKQFDDGPKELLGQQGAFDSQAAVEVLLAQPAASRHVAARLLRELVHPEPAPEHVEHYASRLLEHRWEIKPVLREMLASRLFFSDYAYRALIKSPATLVVGGMLAVGGKPNARFARDAMNRMGQALLIPPTVKGWDGQEAWVNANTLLIRFNFGLQLATQRGDEFARKSDLEAQLTKRDAKTPERIIDHYARLLLDGRLSDDTRDKLLDYMGRDEKNKPAAFVFNARTLDAKVRGLVHLMMATPEFQLA